MKRVAIIFALLICAASARAQITWPGQSGDPVGYAAYGAIGTTPCSTGLIVSGTAGNPTVLTDCVFTTGVTMSASYFWCFSCDFQNNAVTVTGDHDLCVGCRIQSNALQGFEVYINGGTNFVCLFCSSVPLTSYYTSPPGGVWPSAGAGLNTATQVDNVNAVAVNEGYEYSYLITSGSGPVTLDSSDMWGEGAGVIWETTTAQMILSNSWIHDHAQATGVTGGDYHTDGAGYTNGGAGPDNVDRKSVV